ncbi:hypothetical protein ACHAXT_012788 [Thalassiosira profunda]
MGAGRVATEYGMMGHRQAISVGVSSAPLTSDPDTYECDACPRCQDTCGRVDSCISCQKKLNALRDDCPGPETNWLSALGALSGICHLHDARKHRDGSREYTMCQLRRHNTADSAWILVGDTIYDATPYIKTHPGGLEAILRKSGGAANCTEDLRFHSKRAQKEWRRYMVGKLIPCSCSKR